MSLKKKKYPQPTVCMLSLERQEFLLAGSGEEKPKGSEVYDDEDSDTTVSALSKPHSVWDAWDDDE